MYDKSLSIFSPEGTLSQVEYAMEAVKHGGLSIGVTGKRCLILIAERKAAPKLQDQRTIRKIGKIDSHISMTFAGIVADSRSLFDYGRLESQSFRYSLDTPPTVDYVAKQIAFRKQDYTQKSGVRPFGLSCLIGGFDEGTDIPKLYMTDPSGQITQWKAAAIGKNSEKVIGLLENGYTDDMSQEDCLLLAIDSMMQYVESGSKNMEIGLMIPGQNMQILTDEFVDDLIKKINDKKKDEN
ncbi:MAG: archaeal proteasome endopeptidase complex subunit alpha [archaeon]|nr:archaeal proteasome endopeptidase complex subunit alpha [archaeon]